MAPRSELPARRSVEFGLGAVAIVLAGVPLVIGGSRYLMTLAIDLVVVASYAVALNLLLARTGQLFLCLGALAGVSAYGTVLLADRVGVPLVVAVGSGVSASAALGVAFSLVAARRNLGVIFLGIVTLAFSLVFTQLLLGGGGLTGGETGLVIEAGTGSVLRDRIPAYYLLLGVLIGSLVLMRVIDRSYLGWAFGALKDDPRTAELAGVDVTAAKAMAALLGSTILGVTGALSAVHDGFLSPTGFDVGDLDIRVLVVLGVGGVGSLLGPVVGAVVVTALDELLRPLGQLRLTVYGLVLVVIFLRFRDGMLPAFVAAGRRWARPRGRGAA
jgi:branched-chain amino acid transport system permease protein